MKNYKARVIRLWWVWMVSTIVTLGVVLALAYGLITLIVGIPDESQPMFLYILGGCGLCITFFLGQAVQSILVRSWETWLGDMGPTTLNVLIDEMTQEVDRMEKEA